MSAAQNGQLAYIHSALKHIYSHMWLSHPQHKGKGFLQAKW